MVHSVKHNDVTGNSFEWLLDENNVTEVPPPHTSPIRLLDGKNVGQGY